MCNKSVDFGVCLLDLKLSLIGSDTFDKLLKSVPQFVYQWSENNINTYVIVSKLDK